MDRLWLLTRRWLKRNGVWHSSLVAWRLDDNDLYPVDQVELKFPRYTGVEQYEDPRVTFDHGKFWVSYMTWRHGRIFRAHQGFSSFDAHWQHSQTFNVPYGGNGYAVGTGSGHEKNWIWFKHDGVWHFVYSFEPHVVIRMNAERALVKYESSQKHPIPWIYGEPRGGTPPVRVGDEYVSFFHSSLAWRGRQKRYYVGAYAFDSKPPFAVKRLTRKPLLIGSEKDTRLLGGPLVVFPNGALLDKGEWLVSFGLNDEACGWIKIQHKELDRLLQ